jgi:kumamolisin
LDSRRPHHPSHFPHETFYVLRALLIIEGARSATFHPWKLPAPKQVHARKYHYPSIHLNCGARALIFAPSNFVNAVRNLKEVTMTVQNRHQLATSERAPMKGAELIGPADLQEKMEVTVFLRRGSEPSAYPNVAQLGLLLPKDRRHLTREAFAKQHGARAEDMSAVSRFAANYGLQVKEQSTARRSVVLAGTVQTFSHAFEVKLNRYEHPTKGSYRGREGTLSIPADLALAVEGVFGLDNRPQARPHFRIHHKAAGQVHAQAQELSYPPTQVAKAYNFPDGDGTGQSIAILELGGGYKSSDLNSFFSNLNLATPQVSAIGVDGGSNAPTGDPNGPDGEVELDIEVTGAIAPKAQIGVYFAPNTDQGFLDALTTAIHDTNLKPDVISISWAGEETSWTQQARDAFDSAAQDAATMGVTIFVAAGDSGAHDGVANGPLVVEFPTSCPNMTGCGGTTLVLSGTAIQSEVVWNELKNNEGATGGGVSMEFPLPTWQQNANVPKVHGKVGRGVPDVAGDADPSTGYSIFVDGSPAVIGGTSAVAPLWAGLTTLINASLGQPVGFLNPLIYSTNVAATFQDITQGNNDGYKAAKGWDPCTGLGTPNGAKLLAALSGKKSAGS